MSRVIIDTGALYAFVVRTDAHHVAARAQVKSSLGRAESFILLDLVFAETMTLMKARLGPDVALKVGRELRENPLYAWRALGPDLERETWGLFQKFADKEWSYTDCAILAASRTLGAPRVFSFDRHFLQMPGIHRVPGAEKGR